MDEIDWKEMQAVDVLAHFANAHRHLYAGDRKAFEEVGEALQTVERMIEDQGAFDNDVCSSAPRPLVEGNTEHKFDDETGVCDECGASKD